MLLYVRSALVALKTHKYKASKSNKSRVYEVESLKLDYYSKKKLSTNLSLKK